jgi:XTP/dITP diphosphohydrolase
VPVDLIPSAMIAITVSDGIDAENALRSAGLEFMDDVRAAEQAVAAVRRGAGLPQELDGAVLGAVSEAEWRATWPTDVPDELDADELEPISDEMGVDKVDRPDTT